MTSKIKSADDLIVKTEAEKLRGALPEPTPEAAPAPAEAAPVEENDADQIAVESETDKEISGEEEEKENLPEVASSEEASTPSEEDIDEYGSKVTKSKMYSEEEVQNMIRDRLKRVHAKDSEVKEAAKDFSPDPESDESWETQLEGFIEKTIQKREAKREESAWQAKEEQTMAEFEVKFNEGMGKYKDFKQVVEKMPVTTAMMMATRSMKDPAAFLYAASKNHGKELERIAKIPDGFAQSVEIGRLEERMKKARSIPSSPKPASKITSDTSTEMPSISIEARIAQHAKTKVR